MKKIFLVLTFIVFLIPLIIAQHDQRAHYIGNSEDDDEPGPLSKYGWIIIIGGLAWGFYKSEQQNKKNK